MMFGLLGGSIEIESTVGQGTQISIHAPLMKSMKQIRHH
jgi:chemotaxis protein histidine kinase CheA